MRIEPGGSDYMPTNDVTHEITAVFGSAEEARRCQALLEERLPGASNAMRISAERVLHVESTQGDLDRIVEALRSAGGTGIKYSERQRDSGWMGHVYGRVTGAALTPGEGDAEAGGTEERRS
jgi:hypothetical protein